MKHSPAAMRAPHRDTIAPAKVRQKPGPKPLSKNGEVMKPRAIRMTDAEWVKCMSLGGGPWIRERIRTAHVRTT